MTLRRTVSCLCVAMLVTASARTLMAAGPVPRADIEDAIGEGVERILKTQRADGAYILDTQRFDETTKGYTYAVGVVALGVLAVEHALPHLKGDLAVRARESKNKAIAWIRQQPLEQKTYSASMAVCALHADHPDKHRKMISDYAEMLVLSQHRSGDDEGAWGYYLHPPLRALRRQQLTTLPTLGAMDHSNTQFAVLGLLFAEKSDFQVPKATWKRLEKHYIDAQNADGGWGYRLDSRRDSYANMTLACTISLAIAEEMLQADEGRHVCKPPPASGPVDRGIEWIAKNLDYNRLETYGFYATERLGILSGLSEFGGKPWFDEGAERLVKNRRWPSHGAYTDTQAIGAAFAVLFLSRGLEPVIINKLKRSGTDPSDSDGASGFRRSDWNNDPYDVKHLVEYISSRFQRPKQWRIVTLDADVPFLLRTPILYVNGHDALSFTESEQAKIKAYVEGGGTLFGMACCGRKAFEESFEKLVTTLWPEGELEALPKTHPIYTTPRPLVVKPTLLGMPLGGETGRMAVIYAPGDMCCRWHASGSNAKAVFDVGANITFYVDKIASRRVPTGPVPVQGEAR